MRSIVSLLDIRLLGICLISLVLTACDDWQESYDPYSEKPYGLDLLPAVLEAHFGEDTYQELARNWNPEQLADYDAATSIYVAVAPGLLYTQTEADSLLSFANRGGRVVVACKALSHKLIEPLTEDSCLFGRDLTTYYYTQSTQTLTTAKGKSFEWPTISRVVDEFKYGETIYRNSECLPGATDLIGRILDQEENSDSSRIQPWMIRIPHGSGSIDYLSMPLMLTNVYAVDSVGRQGIQAILDFYPSSASAILYDRERRSSVRRVNYENNPQEIFGGGSGTGDLLEHMLGQLPVALAWYSLLLGFIAFLIFGAKRRQRVIPLIQPRKNTTHDHLEKISMLYLANPNNSLMSAKQLALFEAYCGRRFGLSPLRKAEDLEKMKRMPGINSASLDSLLRYQNTINRKQTVSPGGLVQLVRILQDLYKSLGRKHN